jgi:hypothetical protein
MQYAHVVLEWFQLKFFYFLFFWKIIYYMCKKFYKFKNLQNFDYQV